MLTVVPDLHLLSPARFEFPEKATEYAASPVPSLKDWPKLWAAWDTVTKAMVPREELLNKPIKLRNNLIFYLGHIPTFAGRSPDLFESILALTSLRHPLHEGNRAQAN
jgi:hypothetical protein